MTLQDYFKKALKEGWAVPHINVASFEQFKAAVNVAKRLGSPLHIGTSEGERKYLGGRQAVFLVNSFRESLGIPIFLNADHHKTTESAKEAIDEGYESVHIDLSEASFEENIKGVADVVEYANSKNTDISVEGELGYLVTASSKLYKKKIEIPPESLTKPEDVADFIKKTKVNRFAPAVGNLHGIAANEPQLDIERIKQIRAKLSDDIAVVLHGGSGIPDNQIKEAIGAGVNNIHISTEVRVVYVQSLKKSLADNPEEISPYKIMPSVVKAMEKKIEEKIKLFGAANRI